MRFCFPLAHAGVWSLLLCSLAGAQGATPLTLPDALKRSLEQQPALRGFAYQLRGQDARVAEAALRPATSVGLLIEDVAGTGERSGFDSAQTTLSLSQVIEFGSKREARIAVAEGLRSRLQTEQTALQLDVAAEVARRFVETLHKRELEKIAEQGVLQAEATRTAVDRRVQAALAPAAESARAEVRLSQARLDLEHAEHQLQNGRVFLAAAMGDRTVRFGETVGDLYAIDELEPVDDLLRRVEASPQFAWFINESRLRDAQLRLAQLQRRPDLRGEVGVRRYEQGDDLALMAGITVPLMTTRRSQYEVDVARAERERTDADRETAFLKVQAQLLAQYGEVTHAVLEARTLRSQIIPQLENVLNRTEYAYQRGRYSYLELTVAQGELLAARRRLADVAADFHNLRIEIERLTGESLDIVKVTP